MERHAEIRPEYEVVIVGGRPAGASLAARLGARGIDTLVIDKATFPSLPGVPSCAVLYPPAMALLDELGVDQRRYGDDSASVRRLVVEVAGAFRSEMSMVEVLGRDYVYGIDRDRFDAAVWDTLARHPSVTACQGVSFVGLVRDADGRVQGIRARTGEGPVRTIRARAVVGADGRFSAVAHKAGARVREDHAEHTSTVHFASWGDVAPVDDDPRPVMQVFTSTRGVDLLLFPMPRHRMIACTHVRSDRVRLHGDATAFYLRTLQAFPGAWRRLRNATQHTPVVGLRRVANRYLEPGGPGWVLVGDALHHKDPVDGQGIYDALLGAKLLADELETWRRGEQSWEAMVARYDRRMHEQTHDMFLATVERLRRELYRDPPALVVRTLMRWMMTDEEYARRFMLYLCRSLPPRRWLTPGLMARAIARGMLGDLRRMLGRSRAV